MGWQVEVPCNCWSHSTKQFSQEGIIIPSFDGQRNQNTKSLSNSFIAILFPRCQTAFRKDDKSSLNPYVLVNYHYYLYKLQNKSLGHFNIRLSRFMASLIFFMFVIIFPLLILSFFFNTFINLINICWATMMQSTGDAEIKRTCLHAPFLMESLENKLLTYKRGNWVQEDIGCGEQEKHSDANPRMLQRTPGGWRNTRHRGLDHPSNGVHVCVWGWI